MDDDGDLAIDEEDTDCYSAGVVYYFSGSGDDNWNGRSPVYLGDNVGPKRSLDAAESLINDLLVPGDKLLFRRGQEFVETSDLHALLIDSAHGSSSQPLLISGYGPGDRPVLKNNRPGGGDILLIRSSAAGPSHDIEFEGLVFTTDRPRSENMGGLMFNEGWFPHEPHSITIRNSVVTELAWGIINYASDLEVVDSEFSYNFNEPGNGHSQGVYSRADNVRIIGNSFHRNGKYGNFFDHGLYISYSSNIEVSDNICFDSTDCMKFRSSSDIRVRNNIFNDLMIAAIIAGGDSTEGTELNNLLIENNQIMNVPLAIAIRSQSGDDTDGSHHVIIRNNIMSDQADPPGLGFIVLGSAPISNLSIYNNILDSDQGMPLIRIQTPNPQAVNIRNNILRKSVNAGNFPTYIQMESNSLPGILFSHNIFFWDGSGSRPPLFGVERQTYSTFSDFQARFSGQSLGSILGNPGWLNQPEGNYLISSTSPAFDAGITDLSIVPTDIDGVPRPQFSASDIGPYEVVP